ncbi:MAG: hypothetical protein AAF741_10540 [Bacteroidota bacterium]
MKKLIIYLPISIFGIISTLNAQSTSLRLNGNQAFILGADYPSSYPFLGFFEGSFEPQNGLLVGGFGLGVRVERPLGNKFLEYHASLGRSRTYEPRIQFTDENAQPIGLGYGINTNYYTGIMALIAWPLDEKKNLRFHTGAGLRGIFVSRSKYWLPSGGGESLTTSGPNNSLNTYTIILPIELSYRLG